MTALGNVQICCFGNPLHGDDAVGLHVYQGLQASGKFSSDQLHFFADVPLNALSVFEKETPVILIDALKNAGELGSVHSLSLDEICEPQDALCSHMNSIPHLIQSAQCLYGPLKNVRMWGVCSGGIDVYSHELSAPVSAGVKELIKTLSQRYALESVNA